MTLLREERRCLSLLWVEYQAHLIAHSFAIMADAGMPLSVAAQHPSQTYAKGGGGAPGALVRQAGARSAGLAHR